MRNTILFMCHCVLACWRRSCSRVESTRTANKWMNSVRAHCCLEMWLHELCWGVTCARAMAAACTQWPIPAQSTHTHTHTPTWKPHLPSGQTRKWLCESEDQRARETADMSWHFASMINIYILICWSCVMLESDTRWRDGSCAWHREMKHGRQREEEYWEEQRNVYRERCASSGARSGGKHSRITGTRNREILVQMNQWVGEGLRQRCCVGGK